MQTATAPTTPIEPEDAVVTRVGGAALIAYLCLGIFFGILLIKSEVISWFRIQEMFRFQGFHMYGILGSAVIIAALSIRLIRRFGLRSLGGDPIELPDKEMGGGRRYLFGGISFGLGWGLTGACPGPILALIGYGVGPFLVVFASAIVGTWAYGHLRPRLPH